MFDQLVESTSERKNATIMTLFLVNSVLGAIALFATVVIGIMWYDAQLNYEFEKLALVAMAPPAAAPPPRSLAILPLKKRSHRLPRSSTPSVPKRGSWSGRVSRELPRSHACRSSTALR